MSRILGPLAVIGMYVAASVASPPVLIAQSASRPVLLAIFAHPDDEIAVGPLLARYETQYTQQERDTAYPRTLKLLNGFIYLRPAFAQEPLRTDLFR